jgi:hyperosmotically inducible protein
VTRRLTTALLAIVVITGSACSDKAVAETKKDVGAAIDTTRVGVDKAAELVTDGWITAKVKAKFGDETILKGSDVTVDTNNFVVTLKGTVPSAAARARAVEIASGTERVSRVVDRLLVNR